MAQPKVRCCQILPDYPRSASPISKIIALGFYDGPTAGALRCQVCSRAFRFNLLSWGEQGDDELDVGEFSLAPLPDGAFEDLVGAIVRCTPLSRQ